MKFQSNRTDHIHPSVRKVSFEDIKTTSLNQKFFLESIKPKSAKIISFVVEDMYLSFPRTEVLKVVYWLMTVLHFRPRPINRP